MTLSFGYLTAKQKMIWDLKSRGKQEASIARELNLTRQTIHSVLDIANLKIGDALTEVAKINKIDVETMDPHRGFLKGYSNHFKTLLVLTETEGDERPGGGRRQSAFQTVRALWRAPRRPAGHRCH